MEDLNAAGEPALHAEDGIVDQRKVDGLRPTEVPLLSTQNFFIVFNTVFGFVVDDVVKVIIVVAKSRNSGGAAFPVAITVADAAATAAVVFLSPAGCRIDASRLHLLSS